MLLPFMISSHNHRQPVSQGNKHIVLLVVASDKSTHLSAGYCLVYHKDAGATQIYLWVLYCELMHHPALMGIMPVAFQHDQQVIYQQQVPFSFMDLPFLNGMFYPLEKKTDRGFLLNPTVFFALENTVRNPVRKKRWTFTTRS